MVIIVINSLLHDYYVKHLHHDYNYEMDFFFYHIYILILLKIHIIYFYLYQIIQKIDSFLLFNIQFVIFLLNYFLFLKY